VGTGKKRTENQLIILSGPSGVGKATLLKHVIAEMKIKRVVTYTTRKPRPGEIEGIDYHFVSDDEFSRMLKTGELIEAEQVYGDYYYGSPKDIFDGDIDVIMELDTKGTGSYREIYSNIVTIFIIPPSIDELVRRIKARHPEANFKERVMAAKPQLEAASQYDYIVINDEVERVGQEILGIIRSGKPDPNRNSKLELVSKLIRSVAEK